MAPASLAKCRKSEELTQNLQIYKEQKREKKEISPAPSVFQDKEVGDIHFLFSELVTGSSLSGLLKCLIIARDGISAITEDLVENTLKPQQDNTLVSA